MSSIGDTLGNKTSYKREPNKVEEPEKGTFSETPAHGTGVNRDNQIVRSGLQERICLLVFQGASNREIARKLGMDRTAVNRYVKSDHFAATYEQQKAIMLGQVADTVRDDILEITLVALRDKIALLRSKDRRVKPELRNKIQTELIKMGMEFAKVTSGGLSGQMKAVFEKVTKKKNEDGSETTTKERIEGPAGPGEVTIQQVRPDSAGSRPKVGAYAGGGDLRREDGAEETPESTGTPGDHLGTD